MWHLHLRLRIWLRPRVAAERGAGEPGARSLASVAGDHVGLAGTPLSTLLPARQFCGNRELRPMNGHPVHQPGGAVWAREMDWCNSFSAASGRIQS